MIDFKLQGFDVLPDIAGYILFALGFNALAANSQYFNTAFICNVPLLIFSVFSIIERPVRYGIFEVNPYFSLPLAMVVFIASVVLGLLTMYYMFMGIKEMAEQADQGEIYEEAGIRWNQYLTLMLAVFFGFIIMVIPPLAFIYVIGVLVATIVLTIKIMGLLNRCGEML